MTKQADITATNDLRVAAMRCDDDAVGDLLDDAADEIDRLRAALAQAIDFATLHGLDRPGDEIAQEVFANLRSVLP